MVKIPAPPPPLDLPLLTVKVIWNAAYYKILFIFDMAFNFVWLVLFWTKLLMLIDCLELSFVAAVLLAS